MITLPRPLAVLAAAVLLTGCNICPKPEPKVVFKDVFVPTPTPCHPRLRPPPSYADSADALQAAKDISSRVTLLLIGREQRQERERALEAALAVCAGPPPDSR